MHATCSHSQLLSHLRTCCCTITKICFHFRHLMLHSLPAKSFLQPSDGRGTFFSFFFFKLIWLMAKARISHRVICKEKIKKIADESPETPFFQIFHPALLAQISETLERMLPAVESKPSDDSWLGISSCHCLSLYCSEELISLLKAINIFLNPAHSYSLYFDFMKQ